jgi:voltage-dependent calcium channel L type alpha-1D
LKALRLLRMIKLARSWGAMQEILGKTYLAMGDISFVFIILFLFIYIAALLGMEMFANKCFFAPDLDGDLVEDIQAHYAAGLPMEPPREHFDDTVSAITTVFIVSLGEDWPGIMYKYTRVYNYNPLILLYFIITYSIGNFMLLSLFTAVLLSRFEGGDGDD